MFFHLFKYRLITLLRSREITFWAAIFPLILATLFNVSFGQVLTNNDYNLEKINVALVTKSENEIFTKTITAMDDMFIVHNVSDKEADDMLSGKKVSGIIYVCDEPYMKVAESGTTQTIIKTFIDEYAKQSYVITQTATTSPKDIEKVIKQLNTNKEYLGDLNIIEDGTTMFTQYFYALIAMTCLFSCYTGLDCSKDILANISTVGKRREIGAAHKLIVIISDTLAGFVFQTVAFFITYAYLVFGLKIELGNHHFGIIVASLLSTLIGLCMGICMGSAAKFSEGTRNGIITGISMTFCFLSDLMVSGIKYTIEKNIPILNRINPAALLTDAMYALNIYGYGTRYYTSLAIMAAIAITLTIISYCLLRRTSYANL